MTHKRAFFGGMDADTDYSLIGENDWLNAENVRIFSTDTGAVNRVESIGGNALITNPYLPSGTNTCIGGCEDESKSRLIWAVHNSSGNHAIFCYEAGVIYRVIQNSQVTGGLNFSTANRINDMYLINGILYWNDANNPPRKLNLEAAIKLNHSGYTTTQAAYISPLEAEMITVARKPPELPLFAGKFNDAAITVNNISDFAGQFAARYVFRDGEVSVLSPISNLINYNTITEDAADINYILVNWTTLVVIPQDVKQVDFCVRYGNSGNFYIIKSWNKDVASELAEINDNNSGTLGLQYKFLNDRTGIVLDSAYSVKPYDSIPVRAEAMAIGVNRMFLANYDADFDTPNKTSLSATLTSETSTVWQNPVFKAGSQYQVGIIFRDKYKRVIGNVVTKNELRLTIPERDYAIGTYISNVALTLSNATASDEIPVEAYYYQIVVTKNLRTRFFMQFKSADTQYVIKDSTTGAFTFSTTFAFDRYALAFDMKYLLSEGMGYTFSEGDFVKVHIGSAVYNMKIIGQDGNYLHVQPEDIGSLAVQPDAVVEIYTPYRESGNEPFYTTGVVMKVTNPEQVSRTYSTLGATIKGDTYIYGRNIPSGSYNAENMSTNKRHWQEWLGDWGEVNFVLRSKKVTKKSAVRWSNTILEGTVANGLSTFDALDEKILPLEIGAIRKLVLANKIDAQGNVMLAISESQTASMYLGETQLVGSANNAFVAQSLGVIGTVNILNNASGTVNPESVFQYNGLVVWFDKRNGCFTQYSANGIDKISQNSLRRVSNLIAKDIDDGEYIIGGVDPHHKEFLFSLPQTLTNPPKGYILYLDNLDITGPGYNYENQPYPFDIYDGQPKTLIYKSERDRWMGAMTISQELWLRLGNATYSFKGGNIYAHNQSTPAFFNGEQKRAKIMFSANPRGINTFEGLGIECNKFPFYSLLMTNDPWTQMSDLVQIDFKEKEGVKYAVIFRDRLSPNGGAGLDGNLYKGDQLFGKCLLIVLDYEFTDDNTPLELRFANINHVLNQGHKI